jgi:hypothetical protein
VGRGSSLWFLSFGLMVFSSLLELIFVSVVSSHCPCLRGTETCLFQVILLLAFLWLSIAY